VEADGEVLAISERLRMIRRRRGLGLTVPLMTYPICLLARSSNSRSWSTRPTTTATKRNMHCPGEGSAWC